MSDLFLALITVPTLHVQSLSKMDGLLAASSLP
jgi:hypothetical protein